MRWTRCHLRSCCCPVDNLLAVSIWLAPHPFSTQVHPFAPPLDHSHSPITLSLRQLSEIKATWQISSLICLLLFCFLLPLDFCPSLFVFPLFLVLAALISDASISTFAHCLRSRRNWSASMTTMTTTMAG